MRIDVLHEPTAEQEHQENAQELGGDVARGELNGSWSVPNTESYRLTLMDEGQPALLYVGGQRAATPPG